MTRGKENISEEERRLQVLLSSLTVHRSVVSQAEVRAVEAENKKVEEANEILRQKCQKIKEDTMMLKEWLKQKALQKD
jgi:hypothetical protein